MLSNARPGTTLSQLALAEHLGRSVTWIRQQGEYVTHNGETWARMEFSNHRCAGYKRVV